MKQATQQYTYEEAAEIAVRDAEQFINDLDGVLEDEKTVKGYLKNLMTAAQMHNDFKTQTKAAELIAGIAKRLDAVTLGRPSINQPSSVSALVAPCSQDDMVLDRAVLKTMPYSDYLKTFYWKVVRGLKLSEQPACQLCKAESGLQVHHNTYERRGEEKLSDLTVLCNSCHAKHHGKQG